jgi:hypothetical protein
LDATSISSSSNDKDTKKNIVDFSIDEKPKEKEANMLEKPNENSIKSDNNISLDTSHSSSNDDSSLSYYETALSSSNPNELLNPSVDGFRKRSFSSFYNVQKNEGKLFLNVQPV